MNILNNNRNYLHISDFISLLFGITLELLVAIFSVTLTRGNEVSSVQRNGRPENVLAAFFSGFPLCFSGS